VRLSGKSTCPSPSGSTSASASGSALSGDLHSEESGSSDEETMEGHDMTTSEASGASAAVVSLLYRLKAPTKSEMTRKRKIFTNPPRELGTRKKRPSCSSNPKSVTPAQRVREFPNECFTVSARTLFCDACRQLYDTLSWWKGHSHELPHWSAAAQNVVLVQPSSATSVRVFSLLKASFGPQQDGSLQDYIESSLMLQFNNR